MLTQITSLLYLEMAVFTVTLKKGLILKENNDLGDVWANIVAVSINT